MFSAVKQLARPLLTAGGVVTATVAALTLLGAAVPQAVLPHANAATTNPTWFEPGSVWTGDFGDPTIVRDGSTYYAYASPVGGRVLPVLTSTDLQTWYVRDRYSTAGPPGSRGYNVRTDPAIPIESRNSALDDWGVYDNNDALMSTPSWGMKNPQGPWINENYWAPGVGHIGAYWYAYSPVQVSPTRFCLTVARSTSPLGPFRDISGTQPIQCQPLDVDPGGSIDPFPYQDADGTWYLLWKASGKPGSHPSAIMSVPLGSDGLPVPGAPWTTLLTTNEGSWEGLTVENPSMVTYRGTTYLFYSANLSDALDGQGHSSYASGYAVCPNGPRGACQRVGDAPLLASAGADQGPGGSSAFLAADGSLHMAYATFLLGENPGGYLSRHMHLATLGQTTDGGLTVVPDSTTAALVTATRVSATGGATSPLGQPLGGVQTLNNGGITQAFQGGTVYASPSTPAHYVRGAIQAAYTQQGGPAGSLGYPVSDEICGLRNGGCGNVFQGGSIYWSQATGAHMVEGAIRDAWAASGWENGALGYPVTDQVCGLKNGGCVNHFQGGSIYWTSATGAHVVRGAIRDAWAASGWENGVLGYPTSNEFCGLRDGGCFTQFQGGSIYWSPGSGAHVIQGVIRDAWGTQGWETGSLGYPVTDQVCGLRDGGCVNHFQGGSIYTSPATGTHIVRGAIRDRWAAQGWENGVLGYPTSNEICGLRDGGCFTQFQGGSIYWSPASGAHVIRGAIRDTWGSQGWETGSLGYPVTDEICGLKNGGCGNAFQGGSIYWSPVSGAHLVRGAIRDAWAAQGFENGRLGYPVSNEYGIPGGARSDFQGGFITWMPATGAVITYR